jgi:hypothetical protein
MEDVVGLPYSLSEPSVVGFEYFVAVFCFDQPWPYISQGCSPPTIEVPLQRTTLSLECSSLLRILIWVEVSCEPVFLLVHGIIVG